MYVDYSGWTKERGFFHDKLFVDENKHNYVIQYNDGTAMQQTSSFQFQTADWNNDGDIYTQYGAWFNEIKSDGKLGRGEFWTPEDMVRAVIDADDPDRPKYGNQVKSISGIVLPAKEAHRSLDEQIQLSGQRATNKDTEDFHKTKHLDDHFGDR